MATYRRVVSPRGRSRYAKVRVAESFGADPRDFNRMFAQGIEDGKIVPDARDDDDDDDKDIEPGTKDLDNLPDAPGGSQPGSDEEGTEQAADGSWQAPDGGTTQTGSSVRLGSSWGRFHMSAQAIRERYYMEPDEEGLPRAIPLSNREFEWRSSFAQGGDGNLDAVLDKTLPWFKRNDPRTFPDMPTSMGGSGGRSNRNENPTVRTSSGKGKGGSLLYGGNKGPSGGSGRTTKSRGKGMLYGGKASGGYPTAKAGRAGNHLNPYNRTVAGWMEHFRKMKPEELAKYQQQLWDAGFYHPEAYENPALFRKGNYDEYTQEAVTQLLRDGVMSDDPLSEIIRERKEEVDTAGGLDAWLQSTGQSTKEAPPPFQPTVTNPDDIRTLGQQTSVDLMGRRDDDFAESLVAPIQGQEVAMQRAEYDNQYNDANTGTITAPASPSAFAEQELRRTDAAEVDSFAFLGNFNRMLQMLGLAG